MGLQERRGPVRGGRPTEGTGASDLRPQQGQEEQTGWSKGVSLPGGNGGVCATVSLCSLEGQGPLGTVVPPMTYTTRPL